MKINLQTLISEAKKGKNRDQNLLMDLFWTDVYNYVFSKIRIEEDSEDITIETFTKVFAKLKLYNSDFDFKTWLIAVTHNTMIDYIRKSPKLNISLDDDSFHIEIEEDLPSPEEELIQKQANDNLQSQLLMLKPEYSKILILRFLEEKTYKEIAEELNLSMANVKVRLLRAKQLLKDILDTEK